MLCNTFWVEFDEILILMHPLVVGGNSRKIRELRMKPAFLRCLGPYVTKEELESIYQKIESLTRIFEEMSLFPFFPQKRRDKPTAAGA